MAFTRTYRLSKFDETTATLYIDLSTYKVGSTDRLTFDINVPVVLPVDDIGNVPTGSALTAFLDRHAISIAPDSFLYNVYNLSNFNDQVVNAAAIYTLTSTVEPNEVDPITVPNDKLWIPVLIFPDRVRTPTGSIFDRSIIAAVGGNLGAPYLGEQFVGDPEEKVGLAQYQLLDESMNGSKLHLVHHSRSAGITQEANVTSDIYHFEAPTYIVQSWPKVFNQPDLSQLLQDGADIQDYRHYYYIEHDPLTIADTPGRAWIEYGS